MHDHIIVEQIIMSKAVTIFSKLVRTVGPCCKKVVRR